MDSTESGSRDWKTSIKKVLAPHLLGATNMEEQNDAPHPLNASNGEEQSDASHPLNSFNGEEQSGEQYNTVNPKYDNIKIITFPKNSEDVGKNHSTKKKISSIKAKAVRANNRSQSFIEAFHHCPFSDLAGIEVGDSENEDDEKKEIAKIIAADAKELAENFKKLKFKEKDNVTRNTRKPPKRKHAFKKVADPSDFFRPKEKSLTDFYITPEELNYQALKKVDIVRNGGVVDEVFFYNYPQVLENIETNPWLYMEYDKERKVYEEEKKRLACEAAEKAKKNKPAWKVEMEQKTSPTIVPSEYWDDDLLY